MSNTDEPKVYTFTRAQLIGLLCFAYGGVHLQPTDSENMARRVADLLDNNPDVMALIMCCKEAT